jgi:hypothetical protein
MISDKDSKRIRERMHQRSAMRARTEFSIEVMRVKGGKAGKDWLCTTRGMMMGLDLAEPAAEGKTLKEALAKLADEIAMAQPEITNAELLS